MTAVTVSAAAAQRLAGGHPWVFSSDVKGSAAPGEAVLVRDARRRTLGTAHYSSASRIALRLLSNRRETIDRAFYLRRLSDALHQRTRFVNDTDAYRLCHAEGDRLPGLIVDRYAEYLAVQTLSQGMDRVSGDLISCLRELLDPAGIVLRNDAAVRERENLPLETRVVHGDIPETVRFRMNGFEFHADLIHGQKTGGFLDQRENYLAAARFASGRALDCFTSAGGFALHIASRCETVEAVDSSEAALAVARRNAEANSVSNIRFREADVFALLAGYAASGRRFDTVVLDPPAFAKSRAAVSGALRAYREINLRAIQLLEPGGLLITCSCSQAIGEERFLNLIQSAAGDRRRTLRLLERRGQSLDHPVLPSVAETSYLKCLLFQVL